MDRLKDILFIIWNEIWNNKVISLAIILVILFSLSVCNLIVTLQNFH